MLQNFRRFSTSLAFPYSPIFYVSRDYTYFNRNG